MRSTTWIMGTLFIAAWAACGCDDIEFEGDQQAGTDTDTDSDTDSAAYMWHTFYGSGQSEEGTFLTVDGSGNIYVTGASDSSWTGPSGEAPLHAHSADPEYFGDFFVLKLGPDGAYAWHTFYGSGGMDIGYSLIVDGSGNIYVTGESESSWNGPDGGTPLHASSGGDDLFVLKLAPDGAYAWHTFYGSEDDDNAGSLTPDGSGYIYVTGGSDSSWTGPDGEPPLHANSGGEDLFVLKLDQDGAYVWHTFYGSGGHNGDMSLAVDGSAGAIYVTGGSDSSWTGPGGEAPDHAHSGDLDFFILKLDTDGAYTWHTFYGSAEWENAFDLALDGGGNLYLTGTCSSSWTGPGGETPLNANSDGFDNLGDLFVLKLGPDGAYMWHTIFGSGDIDQGQSLAVDESGNIYVAGVSYDPTSPGEDPWTGPGGETPLHEHSGHSDSYVLKLEPDGAYAWHTFYGSENEDGGRSLSLDGNGNLYVTGDSYSPWTGPSGESPLHEHSGNTDLFVLKHSI